MNKDSQKEKEQCAALNKFAAKVTNPEIKASIQQKQSQLGQEVKK